MRAWVAATVAASLVVGCSHKAPTPISPQITVYFCRAGTDMLVPMPFSVDRNMSAAKLESQLVGQLLAGPAVEQSTVVLFPPGTTAAVDLQGDTVSVNFSGALAQPFRGGASDEIALFKSLTYTTTSVAGVSRVQVLINGRKVPTLPGGEFEIDEPLTRNTFAQ